MDALEFNPHPANQGINVIGIRYTVKTFDPVRRIDFDTLHHRTHPRDTHGVGITSAKIGGFRPVDTKGVIAHLETHFQVNIVRIAVPVVRDQEIDGISEILGVKAVSTPQFSAQAPSRLCRKAIINQVNAQNRLCGKALAPMKSLYILATALLLSLGGTLLGGVIRALRERRESSKGPAGVAGRVRVNPRTGELEATA